MSRKLITITTTFVIDGYSEGDEETLRAEIAGAADDEAVALELEKEESSCNFLEAEITNIVEAE